MRTRMLVTAVTLTAFSVLADSAVWTNVTSRSANWQTLGNWRSPDGGEIAAAPTTTVDTAAFAPFPFEGWTQLQTIGYTIDGDSRTRIEHGLASLTDGDGPYSRRIVKFNTQYLYGCWENGIWLTLLDPNGFGGFFMSSEGQAGVRLPAASESFVPELSNVSAAHRFDVDVPAAKARLDSVYEGGSLVKHGAGELEIRGTTGADTQIHVNEGSVTLIGRKAPDPGDDLPVPGAWMHLDATRRETMLTYYDPADGRTYVTNWADVRGAGRPVAFFNPAWGDSNHAPFLNGEFSVAGTVMDFGRDVDTRDEALGPVGCCMELSPRATNARELFIVSACVADDIPSCGFGNIYETSELIRGWPGSGHGKNAAGNPHYGSAVAYGDILVDGIRKGNADSDAWNTTLNVVSIGTTNDVNVSALATDRRYDNGSTGGWKIAEAVVYTNVLTHAERLLVHRYLQRKWTKSSDDDFDDLTEAGIVTVAAGGNSVGVPAERSAFVPEVSVADGTLVKSGEGRLRIGSLSSPLTKDVAVEVQAGSVAFGGAEVSDDAPASGAWLWLKAGSEFVSTRSRDDDGKTYVTRWNDCRANQTLRYAEAPSNEVDYVEGAWPTLVENAVGTLPAVDFGPLAKSDAQNGAYMTIVGGGRKVYDMFIAECDTAIDPSIGSYAPFGSTSGCELYTGGSGRFLSDSLGRHIGRNGVWTFNGAAVDPIAQGFIGRRVDEWNVMSFSPRELAEVTVLGGKDRTVRMNSGTRLWGGQRIGEVIYYDRRLSPAERRQTIAYLMKRWRPSDGALGMKITKMTFGEGVEPVVENLTGELTLGEIETAATTLTKRGAGTLKIGETLDAAGLSSLAVEAGSLCVVSRLDSILAKTVLHFDATDVSKMTYTLADNADGTVTTNLTAVADQRGATVMNAKTTGYAKVNPTLKTVETTEGKTMPVFDFGAQNASSSSAFLMTPKCAVVREAHTVFADTVNEDGSRANQMAIFSADDMSLSFIRGYQGQYLAYRTDSYGREMRENGWFIRDDDEVITGSDLTSKVVPEGMHLFSAYPQPSSGSTTGYATIGSMAATHGLAAGGAQIGELIAFSTPLSDAESAYLRAVLMAKWFGKPSPVWTNEVVSVDVAVGATLDVRPDALATGAISGGGTVRAAAVVATGSLALDVNAPFTVSGAFAQSGRLTVTIAGLMPHMAEGEYTLLSADSLEDIDFDGWDIATPMPRGRLCRLVKRGNTVCLEVSRKGLSVTVH